MAGRYQILRVGLLKANLKRFLAPVDPLKNNVRIDAAIKGQMNINALIGRLTGIS